MQSASPISGFLRAEPSLKAKKKRAGQNLGTLWKSDCLTGCSYFAGAGAGVAAGLGASAFGAAGAGVVGFGASAFGASAFGAAAGAGAVVAFGASALAAGAGVVAAGAGVPGVVAAGAGAGVAGATASGLAVKIGAPLLALCFLAINEASTTVSKKRAPASQPVPFWRTFVVCAPHIWLVTPSPKDAPRPS